MERVRNRASRGLHSRFLDADPRGLILRVLATSGQVAGSPKLTAADLVSFPEGSLWLNHLPPWRARRGNPVAVGRSRRETPAVRSTAGAEERSISRLCGRLTGVSIEPASAMRRAGTHFVDGRRSC